MGMSVNLTPRLEEMVRAKVASGMYTSANEVVREALRLMDQQDAGTRPRSNNCARMCALG